MIGHGYLQPNLEFHSAGASLCMTEGPSQSQYVNEQGDRLIIYKTLLHLVQVMSGSLRQRDASYAPYEDLAECTVGIAILEFLGIRKLPYALVFDFICLLLVYPHLQVHIPICAYEKSFVL